MGSPGGVEEERQSTKRLLENLNQSLGLHSDLRFDFYGWEQTVPGEGRPQDLINQALDACDIFVGILGERWGTPPGGPYGFSSGFEEEFNRALERSTTTGAPRIHLFCRDMTPSLLSDPGPQASQVIAFKKKVQADRSVLYKAYNSIEFFREQLTIALLDTLFRSLTTPRPEQSLATTPALLNAGEQLEAGEVARRHLSSSAEVFLYSGAILGAREANFIYQYRHSINPTPQELVLLLCSVGSRWETPDTPGWYWLRNHSGFEILKLVDEFSNAPITAGIGVALRLGEELRADSSGLTQRLLSRAFNISSQRNLLLRFLAQDMGREQLLELISALAVEPEDSLVQELMATLHPKEWLEALGEGVKVSTDLASAFVKSEVTTPELLSKASFSHHVELAELAISKFIETGSADLDVLSALFHEGVPEARLIAAKELVRRGQTVSKDAVLAAQGALQSRFLSTGRALIPTASDIITASMALELEAVKAGLSDLVRMQGFDGPLLYETAIRCGLLPPGQVIDDIDQNFARIIAPLLHLEKESPDTYSEFVKLIRIGYLIGALRALRSSPSDDRIKKLAQKHLENDDWAVQGAAVQLLVAIACKEDLDELLKLSQRVVPHKRLILDKVVELCGQEPDAISRLLAAADSLTFYLAARSVADQGLTEAVPELKKRLFDSQPTIRWNALLALESFGDLEQLLGEYLQAQSYYYDVVCLLDRLIYSPPAVQQACRHDIQHWSRPFDLEND